MATKHGEGFFVKLVTQTGGFQGRLLLAEVDTFGLTPCTVARGLARIMSFAILPRAQSKPGPSLVAS